MTSATDTGFRCSVASEARDEPIAGTASTVRAFVLVECSGPWGVTAVQDCRLPAPVKQRLGELEARHKVRPLLIRRPGRTGRDGRAGKANGMHVFTAYVDRRAPWVERTMLEDPHDLLDLDLSDLRAGRRAGLEPHREPLFLVCTHGRHDACCAERGRPFAAALAGEAPEQTWEVSHIGGDRFAGNALVLPHGLYYGRLGAQDATGFAARHLAGELDLEHLRGRSSYPFAVQAAEVHLRRRLDRHEVDPLVLTHVTREGDRVAATFRVDGTEWRVTMRSGRQEPQQLTCRATRGGAAPTHDLVGIQQV